MTIDFKVTQSNPEQLLKAVGAWQTGHFQLTSGLHGKEYMQCQKIMQYPRYGLKLAELLAAQLVEAGLVPTVVVGPALGAIHWEVFVATVFDQLNSGKEPVRAVFAERVTDLPPEQNPFAIRRGVEILPTDKVLVVEDVTTTGGSVRKVIDLIRTLGAEPIAVGAVVDRSGSTISFGMPFHKLITLNLETFDPSKCPMCKEGIPAIKPGSNKR